ncbi:MAG: bifunctional diaminohydroxyphosphoribosylaminopyrimidine deaminase/5-amino-6-(5-phosphoribosylamino)uracil reductase RibD, partial [Clostridia bacterium]|nr:bifunctional diaminohydroxyphosphoribosylaminopyrimidine deaminase/5-amino-6-(5-phosphoribosylamino)uracil reductase RibD [Clostridia bacterium]
MDEAFMDRAIELAQRGEGFTSPNPMVGAVIVREGKIVGEGFHRRAGEQHAEIIALQQAGEASRGSTLYVNLEPCAHYGRTPPCAEAIINSGVAKVVAAMVDPNPLV